MKRKHLFIIGAMKAGSTSLFIYLEQHPQIIASKPKEPDFFLKQRNSSECESYYKNWENYRINQQNIYMEGSVNYSSYPTLGNPAENICEFVKIENIEPKFIYIVREPIDRIKSQKKHQQFWGIRTFNMTPAGIDYWLIEPSKYYTQIMRYVNLFGRDNIYICFDSLGNGKTVD